MILIIKLTVVLIVLINLLFNPERVKSSRIIKIIISKHNNLEIAIAPGKNEMDVVKEINATCITNNKNARYIISRKFEIHTIIDYFDIN